MGIYIRCLYRNTKSSYQKTGHQEIEGLCKFLNQKFASCTHWEGNVVLKRKQSNQTAENQDYEICNKSYWKALHGGETISTGRHIDTFIKTSDGHWLCKHRIIQHVWTKEDGHINP